MDTKEETINRDEETRNFHTFTMTSSYQDVYVISDYGDDVACYVRLMLVHFIKPFLDSIDCDISAAMSHVVNSVMVTVLAVLVLPVLTLLGL
ncbi:hypothetical protein LSAT2_006240 [Lamellibrachia satsuma]|nr:hypothetical protein LSAT2_006240 [Lamellibrachia satsuma]